MDNFDEDSDEFFEMDIDGGLLGYLKDYPEVKVYFASPLTDLLQDRREILLAAKQAVKEILKACRTHNFRIYDPADYTAPDSNHTPTEVYAIDHEHVESADVVFFFVVGPSTGMGMEAQIAAEATVPRVVLRLKEVTVTRMFTGAPSRELESIEFASADDIKARLIGEMSRIGTEAAESRKLRNEAYDGEFAGIGKFLLKRRIQSEITLLDLSKQTDQTVDWLRRIERDPTASALMSVPLLQRISKALEIDMVVDPTRVSIKAQPTVTLSPTMTQSLDNLAKFVISRNAIDDRRVISLWRAYRNEREIIEKEAVAGREDIRAPLEVEQWKDRYDQRSLFQ